MQDRFEPSGGSSPSPEKPDPGFAAVVVAGGRSRRLGADAPKQFLDLGGRTVLERSIVAVAGHPLVRRVIVVVPAGAEGGPDAAAVRRLPGVSAVVAGGETRARSCRNGLAAVERSPFVLVHDAARPLVDPEVVDRVIRATVKHGAAVPVTSVPDTVKRSGATGFVEETLDRERLRLAQTPQGSRTAWLVDALDRALAEGVDVTDESAALERDGKAVFLVEGNPANRKITTAEDLEEARMKLVRTEGPSLRVGTGYDVHRFGGEGALILGGLAFPGEPGLQGHSDADVVLHAAMDAVLGAAGLADIGAWFPPDDPAFAGAASTRLAEEVAARVGREVWTVVNLDLTVLAERPRIRVRVEEMRARVAACFAIDPGRVGLKATTLEGLGALGRAEGIACQAVALLISRGAAP